MLQIQEDKAPTCMAI